MIMWPKSWFFSYRHKVLLHMLWNSYTTKRSIEYAQYKHAYEQFTFLLAKGMPVLSMLPSSFKYNLFKRALITLVPQVVCSKIVINMLILSNIPSHYATKWQALNWSTVYFHAWNYRVSKYLQRFFYLFNK